MKSSNSSKTNSTSGPRFVEDSKNVRNAESDRREELADIEMSDSSTSSIWEVDPPRSTGSMPVIAIVKHGAIFQSKPTLQTEQTDEGSQSSGYRPPTKKFNRNKSSDYGIDKMSYLHKHTSDNEPSFSDCQRALVNHRRQHHYLDFMNTQSKQPSTDRKYNNLIPVNLEEMIKQTKSIRPTSDNKYDLNKLIGNILDNGMHQTSQMYFLNVLPPDKETSGVVSHEEGIDRRSRPSKTNDRNSKTKSPPVYNRRSVSNDRATTTRSDKQAAKASPYSSRECQEKPTEAVVEYSTEDNISDEQKRQSYQLHYVDLSRPDRQQSENDDIIIDDNEKSVRPASETDKQSNDMKKYKELFQTKCARMITKDETILKKEESKINNFMIGLKSLTKELQSIEKNTVYLGNMKPVSFESVYVLAQMQGKLFKLKNRIGFLPTVLQQDINKNIDETYMEIIDEGLEGSNRGEKLCDIVKRVAVLDCIVTKEVSKTSHTGKFYNTYIPVSYRSDPTAIVKTRIGPQTVNKNTNSKYIMEFTFVNPLRKKKFERLAFSDLGARGKTAAIHSRTDSKHYNIDEAKGTERLDESSSSLPKLDFRYIREKGKKFYNEMKNGRLLEKGRTALEKIKGQRSKLALIKRAVSQQRNKKSRIKKSVSFSDNVVNLEDEYKKRMAIKVESDTLPTEMEDDIEDSGENAESQSPIPLLRKDIESSDPIEKSALEKSKPDTESQESRPVSEEQKKIELIVHFEVAKPIKDKGSLDSNEMNSTSQGSNSANTDTPTTTSNLWDNETVLRGSASVDRSRNSRATSSSRSEAVSATEKILKTNVSYTSISSILKKDEERVKREHTDHIVQFESFIDHGEVEPEYISQNTNELEKESERITKHKKRMATRRQRRKKGRVADVKQVQARKLTSQPTVSKEPMTLRELRDKELVATISEVVCSGQSNSKKPEEPMTVRELRDMELLATISEEIIGVRLYQDTLEDVKNNTGNEASSQPNISPENDDKATDVPNREIIVVRSTEKKPPEENPESPVEIVSETTDSENVTTGLLAKETDDKSAKEHLEHVTFASKTTLITIDSNKNQNSESSTEYTTETASTLTENGVPSTNTTSSELQTGTNTTDPGTSTTPEENEKKHDQSVDLNKENEGEVSKSKSWQLIQRELEKGALLGSEMLVGEESFVNEKKVVRVQKVRKEKLPKDKKKTEKEVEIPLKDETGNGKEPEKDETSNERFLPIDETNSREIVDLLKGRPTSSQENIVEKQSRESVLSKDKFSGTRLHSLDEEKPPIKKLPELELLERIEKLSSHSFLSSGRNSAASHVYTETTRGSKQVNNSRPHYPRERDVEEAMASISRDDTGTHLLPEIRGTNPNDNLINASIEYKDQSTMFDPSILGEETPKLNKNGFYTDTVIVHESTETEGTLGTEHRACQTNTFCIGDGDHECTIMDVIYTKDRTGTEITYTELLNRVKEEEMYQYYADIDSDCLPGSSQTSLATLSDNDRMNFKDDFTTISDLISRPHCKKYKMAYTTCAQNKNTNNKSKQTLKKDNHSRNEYNSIKEEVQHHKNTLFSYIQNLGSTLVNALVADSETDYN